MKKIAKNIKFEDALAELEQQVQLLESGELPLEEALAAFQQGVALSKVCMTKLNTVQQGVEKIVVADNGSYDEYELETFADLED